MIDTTTDNLFSFSPSCHWEGDNTTLCITLETKQMGAILHHAPNPLDQSQEAQWGRKIIEEIHRMYLTNIKRHGACEVRLIHRRYDGDIV